MIHESDTYYERCYAADVDPESSMELRQQCWALWLEHYTPGQPPDRVAHARTRLAALEAGVAEPPLPGSIPTTEPSSDDLEALDGGVEEAAQVTERDAETTAAAPTEAGHGPSPADGTQTGVPRPDSPEVRAGYRSPPPVRPTTACDPVCAAAWDRCLPRCDGRERSCRAACQAQYRACQAGCY